MEKYRIRCRRIQPYEFESPGETKLRVVNADNSREDTPARDIKVGQLLEALGVVTAVEPVRGGAA